MNAIDEMPDSSPLPWWTYPGILGIAAAWGVGAGAGWAILRWVLSS